jgi:hypothetical protein
LTWISYAEDFENGVRIDISEKSTIFKRGTNFAARVVCKVGAKVMFLTNSMLKNRGISNGSIGVITEVTEEGLVEGAFPTKDGVQVKQPVTTFISIAVLTDNGLLDNSTSADVFVLRICRRQIYSEAASDY